jgi:hypothetical protein
MIAAETAIASANPKRAISAANSGAKTMPPVLAPFSAQLTARPRRRSNQGATMMLTAAPLIVAQPSDITPNPA